jgi:hypothetical protein
MRGQITQLFGEEDNDGRKLLAQCLQKSLQEYMDRECQPQSWGEPFPEIVETNNSKTQQEINKQDTTSSTAMTVKPTSRTGNIVLQRQVDDDVTTVIDTTTKITTTSTTSGNKSSAGIIVLQKSALTTASTTSTKTTPCVNSATQQ